MLCCLLSQGVMQVKTGMPEMIMLGASPDVCRERMHARCAETHLEGFNGGW